MMEKEVRLIDANAYDVQLEKDKDFSDIYAASGISRARALLKAQATIDPRELRGTAFWKDNKAIWFLFRVKVPVVSSSSCGSRFADALKPGFYEHRFCPNCGRKMEG